MVWTNGLAWFGDHDHGSRYCVAESSPSIYAMSSCVQQHRECPHIYVFNFYPVSDYLYMGGCPDRQQHRLYRFCSKSSGHPR
ncbi:hypothetical protein CFP56_003232 [Quercus suber]|uniref:Uncharacterized protein n=1 Tax=Quercus suber TaxID=58331 RepID=A0AAW0LCF8_QUESU